LALWLECSLDPEIRVFPPATEAQIAARELSLGGTLPSSLRTFYGITDGIESSELRILGHSEAYTVDSVHIPALLISWDSDNHDDYVVVVSLDASDERVYRLDVHAPDPVPNEIAASFREYLAARAAEVPPVGDSREGRANQT
jgi:cell wall assembly regulator SMI1